MNLRSLQLGPIFYWGVLKLLEPSMEMSARLLPVFTLRALELYSEAGECDRCLADYHLPTPAVFICENWEEKKLFRVLFLPKTYNDFVTINVTILVKWNEINFFSL